MPDNPIVRLDHAWKRYQLGEEGGVGKLFHRGRGRQELWSLQDLSLEVRAGESVGLVGHNGAGKTTTLKLLAGITRPTRGTVRTEGRVASLINLGAGFHRELTGRENVYLNGVILGLSRREIRERFDEIVEFAELGDYIDTPVKQYSTGMYARLGFAVAAHVDPDVLLVDEVLSVGDVSFQDRSIRKMLSFRESGCAILFVSHNLSAIEMMCQRAVWLDHGRVLAHGPAPEVVRAYLDAVDQELVQASSLDTLSDDDAELIGIEDITVHDQNGRAAVDFDHGDPLVLQLRCVARATLDCVSLAITIRGDYGPLVSAATSEDGLGPLRWDPGRHLVECRFDTLPLLPGLYRVEAEVRQDGATSAAAQAAAAFRVATDLVDFGSQSVVGATKSRGGFLAVPYTWRLVAGGSGRAIPGIHLPGGEPVAL